MLVVLATMVVTSAMVVMLRTLHKLPRNLQIHWNVTNATTRTATNSICLVIVADFCVCLNKYLHIQFFIFLSYFFWIHGHPPHIRNIAWCECPTDYHNSTNWICAGISFVFLSFSPSMLCCECEASIIKSGLLGHLNNEGVMIRSLYSPSKVTQKQNLI